MKMIGCLCNTRTLSKSRVENEGMVRLILAGVQELYRIIQLTSRISEWRVIQAVDSVEVQRELVNHANVFA